ncbi:unnamed protein product, partial [Polarella glacialis]
RVNSDVPWDRKRGLAELAAASAQERGDAELVRRRLPARIDALLPQELTLCFEHDLWENLAVSAAAVASCEARAEAIAIKALRQSGDCAAAALEGLESRLRARGGIASPDAGIAALSAERRAELLLNFSGELAELVASAVPRIAQLALPHKSEGVAREAEKQLRWIRESWEAVLTCKTQITDLYMDNDELSEQRQAELLAEAADLLEECSEPPKICESEVPQVRDFLVEALRSQHLDESLRRRLMQRLE